jgi:hypothetical protein
MATLPPHSRPRLGKKNEKDGESTIATRRLIRKALFRSRSEVNEAKYSHARYLERLLPVVVVYQRRLTKIDSLD